MPTLRAHPAPIPHRSTRAAIARAVALAVVLTLLGFAIGPGPVAGQTGASEVDPGTEADPASGAPDEETAELLREGQQVYSQICSSCHQPGGTGLVGQFPPLLDNPRVDDSAYVADVIENGLSGPLVVDGETYDGVMPAFSTLSDGEVEAVTAYLQADFVAPATEEAAEAFETGPVAGTELPALTDMTWIVAYLLAAAIGALVLAPRLLSTNDRLSVPWLDAWLKTAAILAAVAFFVVYVPDWALRQGAVSKLSRFGQDVVGTGLWTIGIGIVLAGLWYAHRESRV